MIKSLYDAALRSVESKKQKYYAANFKVEVENETWTCHEVSVTYRDLLLFCDKGCANYLVDSYGEKHVIELFDWERDK